MKHRLLPAAAAAAGLLAAGCGGSSGSGSGHSPTMSAPAKVTGTVTVLGAASLTGAFGTIAQRVEAAHPGLTVRLSFGGSDDLAAQIVNGSPADVFASASPKTMDTVTKAEDNATSPVVFARNRLEIAVPKGNPGQVRTLADTTRSGVKLALCAAQVPCGAAARAIYTLAKLTPHPVTEEPDVKSVLTKVTTGEVDAGMVYRTDVQAAGSSVVGINFAQAGKAINDYPIATLRTGTNAAGAAVFVAYVRSAAGRKILQAAGFQSPG